MHHEQTFHPQKKYILGLGQGFEPKPKPKTKINSVFNTRKCLGLKSVRKI